MISSPARGSHFSPLERFIPSPVKIGDAKLLRFKELLQEASLGKAVSLQPIMNFAAVTPSGRKTGFRFLQATPERSLLCSQRP
jgi:hypothetical protein